MSPYILAATIYGFLNSLSKNVEPYKSVDFVIILLIVELGLDISGFSYPLYPP
jgi:hypothetical protein